MSKVLVIGPSYKTEIIHFRNKYAPDKVYPSRIMNYLCGGSYTIAYNLAVLGCDTFFITRLSYDQDANNMILNFDNVNGMLYSNNHSLSITPSKVYLFDKDNRLSTFNNINYDVHPSLEDGIPSEYFKDVHLGVIEIVNANYLAHIINTYPNIRWICNNSIPSDALLPKIEGIVLDYEYACNITVPSKFDLLAQQIFEKGAKWLIITNNGKEVFYFSKNQYIANPIEKEESGKKIVGTHEAFISMLTACLAEEMTLDEAVDYAINLANNLSYEDDIFLNPKYFD